MTSVLFRSNAEGEELQKLIHAAGFKHLEQDEYLDADGNHCLGSRASGAYEITHCDGEDCSLWSHATDEDVPFESATE